MRTSRLLPLAVALVCLGSSSAPQEPPVFVARADLVVIDLIATDGEQVPQRVASTASLPKKGRLQLRVAVRHSGGRLAAAAAELVVP